MSAAVKSSSVNPLAGQSPGGFDYCPVLQQLLTTRTVTGRTGKQFDGLGAISTKNNLMALRQLMDQYRPERTLEIGLSYGGSALVLTSSHRDLGREPSARHVAIDPYQETVWDSVGLSVVEQAGLSAYLDFRPHLSSLELPRLWEAGERYGLIYVDGSHLLEDVFVDAYYSTRLLCDGGIVAFDDSANSHIGKVVRFLRNTLAESLEELDLMAIPPRRGWQAVTYRLARQFGKVQLTAFRRVGEIERTWSAAYHSF